MYGAYDFHEANTKSVANLRENLGASVWCVYVLESLMLYFREIYSRFRVKDT